MRHPNTFALLLLVPLAAACAAGGGSNIGTGASGGGGSSSSSSGGRSGAGNNGTTSSSSSGAFSSGGFTGSSSSGSSGGSSSGNTSSGNAGGCGLQANDPTCDACLNASCCQPALDCANDSACTSCLGTATPPASCDTEVALSALIACLQSSCNTECFGGGSTSSSSGSTSSGSTASGGPAPTNCTDSNGGVGCCDASGVLHYCNNSQTVTDQPCTGGTVCGWDPNNGWYDCVSPPGGADPSNQNPIACGGGGSTSSSSGSTSSSSSSSSSSGGSATTWTQIYNTMFGPSGTSSCVRNGGCHTSSQSGFKCGTSKSTCYTGIVNSGLVVAGSGASSSPLVNPAQSPLCGSLGGNMPKGGTCISSSQLSKIQSWLAAGAPNN